jgi:hypothetical protein
VGISSDQLTVENLNDSDLLVMGSPTRCMNLPEAVRPVLEGLPQRVLKGKRDILEGTVGYETFFNDFSRYQAVFVFSLAKTKESPVGFHPQLCVCALAVSIHWFRQGRASNRQEVGSYL